MYHIVDESGNETVTAHNIIHFLNHSHYDLFIDQWNEQSLYFGNHGNQILEIDKIFGSEKFQLAPDRAVLYEAAGKILRSQIDVNAFNQKQFLKSATDVIAIDKTPSRRMKQNFLKP